MSNDLTAKLDALGPQSVDYSDPSTYAELLGYNDEPPATEAPAQPQGDTPPAEAAAPAAPAEPAKSSEPPAAAETPAPQEVAGVVTKDGKNYLPFAVLESTREKAKQEAERARAQADLAARLARENEELKQQLAAGAAKPQDEIPGMTDEEIADLEADFPAVAKVAKANRALAAEVQTLRSQNTAVRQVEVTERTNVQPLIDALPLLAQWQAKGGVAWDAAVAMDKQLEADPQWAERPLGERFAEVQSRMAAEFGIAVPQVTTPSPAPAPAPKAGPAAAPAQPEPKTVMPTLTDFNGGAPATDPMAGMPVGKMVDTAMNMDMEALRRMAGLSY